MRGKDRSSEDGNKRLKGTSSLLQVTKNELKSLREVFRWVHRHHPKRPGAKRTDFKATAFNNLIPFIEAATRDYPNLALSDEQADVGHWSVPRSSTYFRVFDAPYQGEHPRRRIQGFLFIARCLIQRYRGQEGWEDQSSHLETLIASLGCDDRACSKDVVPQASRTSDARFVPLALIPDRDPDKARNAAKNVYKDLGEFLRDMHEHPVTMLLGGPGAGKSTLLQSLEREPALFGPSFENLYVPLSEYRPSVPGGLLPEPLPWLEALWEKTHGGQTSGLKERLRQGRVLLLLDAVNEIPVPDAVRTGFDVWGQVLQESLLPFPGNRAVVSCRTLDYVAPLTVGVYVPVLRVQAMDAPTVRSFVERGSPNLSPDEVSSLIEREIGYASFYRIPYFLRLLLDTLDGSESLPKGRAQMFTRFVWRLLRRELDKSPHLFHDPLLTRADRAQIMSSGTFEPGTVLPDEGTLIPYLIDLAFAAQEAVCGSLTGEAVTPLKDVRRFGSTKDATEAACAISILVRNLEDGAVRFEHQLLQEYFAARRVAADPNPQYWNLRTKIGEVAPFEPKSVHERLPQPARTGWEETTTMAACMASNPESFIAGVLHENAVLAARCASSPEVRISDPLKAEVQRTLLRTMRDETIDLRYRIDAGLAIDDLTIFGYQPFNVAGTRCLIPPMVAVAGGEYSIGGEIANTDDLRFHANVLTLPRHEETVLDFQIGTYPVTNAEFGYFVADGGYENDAWWQSDDAKAWRLGDENAIGMKWQMRMNLEIDRAWGAEQLIKDIGHRWSKQDAEERIERLTWTREKHDEWLEANFPQGKRLTRPIHWRDAEFNAPSQPVVGVSWFEASAYCAWLSAACKTSFRLLTESEYEAAAAGKERRTYAYGMNFDPKQCNSFSSRIWKQTPVGLFHNETPEGAHDLTGNVWTWTSSFDLVVGDRESDFQRRTIRGGSYDTSAALATTICRDSNHPGYRDRYVGFRLAGDPRPTT